MRYSTAFLRTLREKPRNADNTAHELLIRAGYLRPSAAGLTALSPLGARVLDLLKARALGAFAASGAGERWITPPPFPGTTRERPPHADLKRALKELRAKPRNQFFLAECHEEMLCALAGMLNASYKDLPVTLASTQWTQRDTARGSTSLLWPRLFPMASAIALAPDEAVLEQRCEALARSCRAALQDIDVVALDATGASGTSPAWREFAVLSESGDEELLLCGGCGYAAEADRAVSVFPPYAQDEAPAAVQSILGENIVGTAELARFAGIDPRKTTKTLIFESDGRPVAVAVRGEYDVSETKTADLLGSGELRLSSSERIQELTAAEVGYAGPVGLPAHVPVLWDHSTAGRVNFEAGANKTHYHLLNLNFDRDVPLPEKFVDVRRAREGELCGRCRRTPLERKRALKIAHVSQPGTLYSETLGASYTAKDGKPHPMLLACCGVDLFRLLAAVVEQHHDARGIAWPKHMAPFDVHLISLPGAEARAEEVYRRFRAASAEVLWDDRTAAAGAKFADADLIGIPARVVISPRTGESIEWKARRGEAVELISIDDAIKRVTS